MKTKIKILLGMLYLGIHSSLAMAGYSSYPPETIDGVNFFEDSDNEASAVACLKNKTAGCISATYLPNSISVAKTASGFPMIVQGIFFSKTDPSLTAVDYNITLQPDYSGVNLAVENYKKILSDHYHLDPINVSVSPINISNVRFVVRSTFGSLNPAVSTIFTNTLTPNWTGDFHNLSSRFSVSIRGAAQDLEPGLQNMMLNQSPNAAVGQISFGFPVKAKVFDEKISCDVKQFQKTFKDMLKTWSITRTQKANSSWETFDNEEKNAIRSTIDIKDYCDFKSFTDTTKLSKEVLDARIQQLFDMLFNSAFKKVSDSTTPSLIEGKDDRYTAYDSTASMEATGEVVLKFSDDQIFYLNSDIDFSAGNITADNLSPDHKFLCDPFDKYDIIKDKCITVCHPATEIYNARSNSCISIVSPASTPSVGGLIRE